MKEPNHQCLWHTPLYDRLCDSSEHSQIHPSRALQPEQAEEITDPEGWIDDMGNGSGP